MEIILGKVSFRIRGRNYSPFSAIGESRVLGEHILELCKLSVYLGKLVHRCGDPKACHVVSTALHYCHLALQIAGSGADHGLVRCCRDIVNDLALFAVEDRTRQPLARVSSRSVEVEEVGAVVVGSVNVGVGVAIVIVVVCGGVFGVVRSKKGVVEPIWRRLVRIRGRFGGRVEEERCVSESLFMVLLLVSEMVE
ncbi:uncharacterized protein HKW66_Vig0202950 [Vigna angularis]|uniref:Uncharacterized protein n=1 Tax=Phaseolus angularis TaxID=3914 RepID=A0A8T0JRY1_PHAAN|nr:uncharacterized protein HKW66_Vig0202950 [Vigna angularis]